jgi:hypothetical protein
VTFMRATKFAPESVILTDWATNELSMGGSAKATIYELMLLSLLYDNVLIQDEVFALSDKCADWFSEDKEIELLRKCFDIEALVLLKHPLFAYPTEELKELAQTAPLYARARYIQRYGSKGDKIFIPNDSQLKLYHNMDAWLLDRPKSQRFVGALRKFDIMPTFGVILKDVLSSRLYKKWRKTAFRGITDKMTEDFIGFIEKPEIVIAKLKQRNKDYKIVLDSDGKPTFNRSLGFLATTLYPGIQAKSMQRLIQTTFAAPFSWRENAAGRYSKFLRELLWTPADSLPENLDRLKKGEIVSVEAHVDTKLPLPDIDSDFVGAINTVRNTPAGKNLRMTMRQIEIGADFNKQREAWNHVAEELAKVVIKKKPINICTETVQVGKDFVIGSIASGLTTIANRQPVDVSGLLEGALLGGGIGVFSRHLMAVLRNDVGRQEFRYKIEHAVEFRCSPIEIPPIATPMINNK